MNNVSIQAVDSRLRLLPPFLKFRIRSVGHAFFSQLHLVSAASKSGRCRVDPCGASSVRAHVQRRIVMAVKHVDDPVITCRFINLGSIYQKPDLCLVGIVVLFC